MRTNIDQPRLLRDIRDLLFRLAASGDLNGTLCNAENALFLQGMHRLEPRAGTTPLVEYIVRGTLATFPRRPLFCPFGGRAGQLLLMGQLELGSEAKRMVRAQAGELAASADAALRDDLVPETDLVNGIVGMVPFLIAEGELAKPLLERVVELLSARGTKALPFRHEEGGIDLGIAHGVPGALVASALVFQATGSGEAERLSSELADFILHHRRVGSGSSFGNSTQSVGISRLAWCYGDLSVCLALAVAGRVTGHTGLIQAAKEIALAAADRRFAGSGVEDPGICHGSFGIAYCFDRLNDLLELEPAEEAAEFWRDHGLKTYFQAGLGSLDLTFLDGLPGIGLYLLSRSGIVEKWDSFMLTRDGAR